MKDVQRIAIVDPSDLTREPLRKIRIRYGSDRDRATAILRSVKGGYWGFSGAVLGVTDRHIDALETAEPCIPVVHMRETAA